MDISKIEELVIELSEVSRYGKQGTVAVLILELRKLNDSIQELTKKIARTMPPTVP